MHKRIHHFEKLTVIHELERFKKIVDSVGLLGKSPYNYAVPIVPGIQFDYRVTYDEDTSSIVIGTYFLYPNPKGMQGYARRYFIQPYLVSRYYKASNDSPSDYVSSRGFQLSLDQFLDSFWKSVVFFDGDNSVFNQLTGDAKLSKHLKSYNEFRQTKRLLNRQMIIDVDENVSGAIGVYIMGDRIILPNHEQSKHNCNGDVAPVEDAHILAKVLICKIFEVEQESPALKGKFMKHIMNLMQETYVDSKMQVEAEYYDRSKFDSEARSDGDESSWGKN